ncbi:MAG: hypothetical protein AABZ08_11130 [Planctomycetota bacterium]
MKLVNPVWPIAILMACLASGQTTPTTHDAGADQAAQLLADLSSPTFRIRDDATARLMEFGADVLGPLQRAFESTNLYDARRRMKEIAREVYLSDKLGPPSAFLGITHNRYDLRSAEEGRVPPGATAIRIESIFPGTSAERAGLLAGDLLIALNGNRATLESPASGIPKWISSKPPGTPCKFGVIRGGSGVRIEVGTRGNMVNVNKLARAPVSKVAAKDLPLLPPESAGLQIGEAVKLSDTVTLKAGDVIISVNDQPLPADDPRSFLLLWISTLTEAEGSTKPDEMEVRMRNGRAQLVPRGAPSIQIVRGGTYKELDARLGRRPAMLRGANPGPWQADPAAVEHATQQFETWWSDVVDPNGSFSEQASQDRRWRMENPRR